MFRINGISEFVKSKEYRIALAIGYPPGQQNLHLIIIYRRINDSNLEGIHFAFWRQLLGINFSNNLDHKLYSHYKWAEFRKLRADNDPNFMRTDICIGIIDTILSNYGGSFDYSSIYTGAFFDKLGTITKVGDGYGFTCSTFPIAFFQSSGVKLVDYTQWEPRENDKERHELVIKLMEKHKKYIPEGGLDKYKKETDNAKFRPEEIFSSSYVLPLPAHFRLCENMGKYVLSKLPKS